MGTSSGADKEELVGKNPEASEENRGAVTIILIQFYGKDILGELPKIFV